MPIYIYDVGTVVTLSESRKDEMFPVPHSILWNPPLDRGDFSLHVWYLVQSMGFFPLTVVLRFRNPCTFYCSEVSSQLESAVVSA